MKRTAADFSVGEAIFYADDLMPYEGKVLRIRTSPEYLVLQTFGRYEITRSPQFVFKTQRECIDHCIEYLHATQRMLEQFGWEVSA
jgi:hypothetical protein